MDLGLGISIIIPTLNRANLLNKALKSISKICQESQLPYEIIIIANGETEKDTGIQLNDDLKVNYVHNSHPGLHVGRNQGLALARFDYLTFFDDDIEVLPGWFHGIQRNINNEQVGLIGGKNLPNWESTPPRWLVSLWKESKKIPELSIIDLGEDRIETSPKNIWGCNYTIKKSILQEVNGFHPDGFPKKYLKYRGDGESHVSKTVKKLGYKVVYDPMVSVNHHVSSERMSQSYFDKRHYVQGISDSFTFLRKKPSMLSIVGRYQFAVGSAVSGNPYYKGVLYHMNQYLLRSDLRKWVHQDDFLDEKGYIANYGGAN